MNNYPKTIILLQNNEIYLLEKVDKLFKAGWCKGNTDIVKLIEYILKFKPYRYKHEKLTISSLKLHFKKQNALIKNWLNYRLSELNEGIEQYLDWEFIKNNKEHQFLIKSQRYHSLKDWQQLIDTSKSYAKHIKNIKTKNSIIDFYQYQMQLLTSDRNDYIEKDSSNIVATYNSLFSFFTKQLLQLQIEFSNRFNDLTLPIRFEEVLSLNHRLKIEEDEQFKVGFIINGLMKETALDKDYQNKVDVLFDKLAINQEYLPNKYFLYLQNLAIRGVNYGNIQLAKTYLNCFDILYSRFYFDENIKNMTIIKLTITIQLLLWSGSKKRAEIIFEKFKGNFKNEDKILLVEIDLCLHNKKYTKAKHLINQIDIEVISNELKFYISLVKLYFLKYRDKPTANNLLELNLHLEKFESVVGYYSNRGKEMMVAINFIDMIKFLSRVNSTIDLQRNKLRTYSRIAERIWFDYLLRK